MNLTDNLSALFKELIAEIGLRDFRVRSFMDHGGASIELVLSLSIPAGSVTSQQDVIDVFRPIYDSVKSSPAVKASLKEMAEERDKALAENRSLNKLKSHFELEFMLRHGKEYPR